MLSLRQGYSCCRVERDNNVALYVKFSQIFWDVRIRCYMFILYITSLELLFHEYLVTPDISKVSFMTLLLQ